MPLQLRKSREEELRVVHSVLEFQRRKERKSVLNRKTKVARQEFLKRHLFVADEVFCAGFREAEPALIKAAREEKLLAPEAFDRDILRALSQSYFELTHIRG